MLSFKKHMPSLSDMRFIIVAPDDLRDKVFREVNRPEFKELHALYLSYSSVSIFWWTAQSAQMPLIT